jgi:hypothetical protein
VAQQSGELSSFDLGSPSYLHYDVLVDWEKVRPPLSLANTAPPPMHSIHFQSPLPIYTHSPSLFVSDLLEMSNSEWAGRNDEGKGG